MTRKREPSGATRPKKKPSGKPFADPAGPTECVKLDYEFDVGPAGKPKWTDGHYTLGGPSRIFREWPDPDHKLAILMVEDFLGSGRDQPRWRITHVAVVNWFRDRSRNQIVDRFEIVREFDVNQLTREARKNLKSAVAEKG